MKNHQITLTSELVLFKEPFNGLQTVCHTFYLFVFQLFK